MNPQKSGVAIDPDLERNRSDIVRQVRELVKTAVRATLVVLEGGVNRLGSVILGPGEPDPSPVLGDSLRDLSVRGGDRRTIGSGDVLAAATVRFFGDIRQLVLTEAREAAQHTSAAEQV